MPLTVTLVKRSVDDQDVVVLEESSVVLSDQPSVGRARHVVFGRRGDTLDRLGRRLGAAVLAGDDERLAREYGLLTWDGAELVLENLSTKRGLWVREWGSANHARVDGVFHARSARLVIDPGIDSPTYLVVSPEPALEPGWVRSVADAPLVAVSNDPEDTPLAEDHVRPQARPLFICDCRARAADPEACSAPGHRRTQERLRTLVASAGPAGHWPPAGRDVASSRGNHGAAAAVLGIGPGGLTRRLDVIFEELVTTDTYRGPRDATRLLSHLVESGAFAFDEVANVVAEFSAMAES